MTDLLRRSIVWRDYPSLRKAAALDAGPVPILQGSEREAAMRRLIGLLWGAFANQHISWIGFYVKLDGREEMELVCREPKPACSPIGLHGMCGRGWTTARPVVIRDVRTLGANYIACDPKDQSELVLPVMNGDGSCWGVLDVDSYELNAFDEHDCRGMSSLLEAMGIGGAMPGLPLWL